MVTALPNPRSADGSHFVPATVALIPEPVPGAGHASVHPAKQLSLLAGTLTRYPSKESLMTEAVTAELPDWSKYAGLSWPTLLVGNGLSINLWDGFRYDSLFNKSELPAEAHAIFAELNTTNFETALECLYHANVALMALKEDTTQMDRVYRDISDALFTAVGNSHIPWLRFPARQHNVIAANLDNHSSVFTTNYDLCLYWSQLESRPPVDIVDFFWNNDSTFNFANIDIHRSSATPIYYLHGGLHLWQDDATGDSGKWISSAGNLLDFEGKYGPGLPRRPLFVSEGTSTAKMRTIQRSLYLYFCLERLHGDCENTVVFGQALGSQDQHIVDALNAGPRRKVAVSIYPNRSAQQVIAEKGRILEALTQHDVVFFDSKTHPLGDPALHVT
jgi:hypothetical protein